MKYGVSYENAADLAKVNEVLTTFENLDKGSFAFPLTPDSFTLGSAAQTVDAIDSAIATSELFLYDHMTLEEVIEAVNTALAEMAKPPEGYELYDNYNVYAYIKGVNSFQDLDDDDINLLVDAANNLGNKTHNSSDCSGSFGDADAYTHNEAANRLFSFKRDGEHSDGHPMLTVLKQGKVNSGTHQF